MADEYVTGLASRNKPHPEDVFVTDVRRVNMFVEDLCMVLTGKRPSELRFTDRSEIERLVKDTFWKGPGKNNGKITS